MTFLDGKALARNIREEIRVKIEDIGQRPHLRAILVGDDPASKTYIRAKSRACKEVGIEFSDIMLPADISQKNLEEHIRESNVAESIHALLIQQPLPNHLDVETIISCVAPHKDVDGFHPVNLGNLLREQPGIVSCTPFGIMKLLDAYKVDLKGKHVVIVNRSLIVGKPLAILCSNKSYNATVTICNSHTKNLSSYTRDADVLVSGIGKPGYFTADHIKKDAVLIDVSINVMGYNEAKRAIIVGDFDVDSVSQKASYLSPVPGGVGPMTVAMLLRNTLECFENTYET